MGSQQPANFLQRVQCLPGRKDLIMESGYIADLICVTQNAEGLAIGKEDRQSSDQGILIGTEGGVWDLQIDPA